MKSVLSIAVSSLLLVSPSLGQGIVEILKANNLTAFAAELSTFPNIIDIINGRNDITVFAPTNSVIEGKNTTLRLRQNSGESRTAALIGKKRPKPTQERTKKRQATVDLPDSNYEIHYSVLEDPEFVNLGPDQPGRFVSNSAGRPDGVGLAFLEVVTGNGDVVSQVDGPFKFNRGVIYSVNNRFTLPQPFTTTLRTVGSATHFYDAVVAAKLLDKFENSPGVTVFAPVGEIPSDLNPNTHIISNFLGYTPDLLPGRTYPADSGARIDITFGPSGERLVNGKRLVKPNVVMKNGVVHFIEGPLDGSASNTSAPNATSTSVPSFTGAAVALKTPFGIAVFAGTIAAMVLHEIF